MADVLVTFGGDSSQLDAAASRARNSLAQVHQSATDAGGAGSLGFGRLTASITIASLAAKGVGAALHVIVEAIKKISAASWEYAGAVKDMSESTGLTIAQVGILGRIAANTGTDLAAFTTGMRTLNSVMGDAMNGSEQAEKKLAQLGIKARDLVDASAIERLRMVAEGISKIGDEATRRAVATDFFGKSTGKLIETLGEFGPAMKEASEGFNEKEFSDAVQSIDSAKIAVDSFMLSLKEGTIVYMAEAIETLRSLKKEMKSFGEGMNAAPRPNVAALAGGARVRTGLEAFEEESGATAAGFEADADATLAARPPDVPGAGVWAGEAEAAKMSQDQILEVKADIVRNFQAMAAVISEAFGVASVAVGKSIEKMHELGAQSQLQIQQSKERLAAVVADLNSEAAMREEYRRIQAEAAGTEEAYHAQLRDAKLQAEQAEHEARLIALMDAQAKTLMTTQEYHARLEEESASHEAKIDDIKRQHAQSQADLEQKKLNTINGFNQKFFGNLATLMNSKNRGMFEVGKAAAIAQATISTYTAAAAGLTWGMANGGPVVAGAVVAATVAAGLAQVANIASTSFGGGGGGAGGGGGGSALESAGTGASQLGNGSGGGGGKRMTVNISGSNFSRDSVEQLLRSIDEAGADGIDVG